ncbi:MAG: peptidase MA family metallohydrolase [Elusimicrobiota bacterium]
MAAAWVLAAVLAVRAIAAPSTGRGWEWRETLTPHFRILHQSTWLPPGLTMGLEHINFRLRMDLGMFSNWSGKDRANIYLYKDMQSYVHGEFAPPPWSNGVAVYDKDAVAVPAQRQTSALLRVLAHENTHLIFVRYFHEGHRDPPSWVNEGLAMLEEADSPDKPETSQWYQSMAGMDQRRWFPMERFFQLSPTRDLRDDKNLVSTFYVQAYAITHFLVRRHSHLQFKSFCDKLRDGQSVGDALRLAYHYRSVQDFEKQWRSWAADPSHKRRVAALPPALRGQGDGVVDQAGQASGFQGFSNGWEIRPKMVFPTRSSDR